VFFLKLLCVFFFSNFCESLEHFLRLWIGFFVLIGFNVPEVHNRNHFLFVHLINLCLFLRSLAIFDFFDIIFFLYGRLFFNLAVRLQFLNVLFRFFRPDRQLAKRKVDKSAVANVDIVVSVIFLILFRVLDVPATDFVCLGHKAKHFALICLSVVLDVDADLPSLRKLGIRVFKVGDQLQVRVELLHRSLKKLGFLVVVVHLVAVELRKIIVQRHLLFRCKLVPVPWLFTTKSFLKLLPGFDVFHPSFTFGLRLICHRKIFCSIKI